MQRRKGLGVQSFSSEDAELFWDHGHLLRTAHKLSATKIEHSHWSTGHSTHL